MKTAETPWYANNSSSKHQLTNTFSIMHQKERLFFKLNQDLLNVHEIIRSFKQLHQDNYKRNNLLDSSETLYKSTENSKLYRRSIWIKQSMTSFKQRI